MTRLIDTINRVLHERREMILQERKKLKAGTSPPDGIFIHRYSPTLGKKKKRNGSVEVPRTNENLLMATQPIPNNFGL